MKKILISMILLMSIIQAKPCMTDIYFGNGIWSPNKKAQEVSLKALKNVLNLDKSKEGQTYNYKLAYNPGHGTINDLIETYWQLKESGQISEGYFTSVATVLSGAHTDNSFSKALIGIILNYQAEVTAMYTVYNDTSFKQKHNVLLVAHSQGNLFGNKMFELFTDAQKERFRMVSVGTMANTVAGEGSYVNLKNDYVVNLVPNSLEGSFDGSGHDFRGVYLNIPSAKHWYDTGSMNAGSSIASYVKSAYADLMETSTCDTYQYYVWINYMCAAGNAQGLIVDIYGRPNNAPFPYEKQIVATDSRIQMPNDMNGNCSIEGDDVFSWWYMYNKNDCYAYSIDDTTGNIHTLDYIASRTYKNGRTCTQYKMSTDVT
ncbi:MAG: hypothetical protein Q9M39_08105 [Sulfurovum sp.]|nr:hypothetical protein [Sulfurovum sp.]